MLNALYTNREWIVPDPGFSSSTGSPGLNQYLTGMKAKGGMFVREVAPKGLFRQAKVQAGDLLLSVDGHKIDTHGQIKLAALGDTVSITGALSRKKVGSPLEIIVYRKAGKKGAVLKLETPYDQTPQPNIRKLYEPIVDRPKFEIIAGLVLMQLNMDFVQAFLRSNPAEMLPYADSKNRFGSPRIVIAAVFPDSMAGRDKSLKAGMLVEEINGSPVTDFETLCKAMKSTQKHWTLKTRLSFTVFSADKVHTDAAGGSALRASTACASVFKAAYSKP